MNFARVLLQLVLCAVLFVASGIAATKKIQGHEGSRDWNVLSLQSDSSLQNGELLNAGSSVSSGSFGFQSSGWPGSSGSSLILAGPGTPDNWNGGTGNWNNAGNWSAGAPGPTNDVAIYSGGNDTVTLDTSPTINSLTLGGASNGTTSELTDGGAKQILTISNALNVGYTGTLNLSGGSTVSAGADSSNVGMIQLTNGSSLSITGNLINSGSLSTGTFHGAGGGNTITIKGVLTNEATGQFILNGHGDMATIGSLTNSGYVDVEGGSTLTINGDVTNTAAGSGQSGIFTSFNGTTGGNTLNIGGMLTNSGVSDFVLYGPKDTATIGSLTNSGGVGVEFGSTLNITGDVTNSGYIFTSFQGGNTITITGTLTNNDFGTFLLSGPKDTATIGSVVNSSDAGLNPGLIEVDNGSTLTVKGDVTNSGNIYTNFYPGSGGNTLTITGMLTNEAGGSFTLYGPGDTATIGSVVNSGEVGSKPGLIDLETGSTLTVKGDVNNSANMYTSFYGLGGRNTITITGTLNNYATADSAGVFVLNGDGLSRGDTATIGSVVNSGTIEVDGESTLTVKGDVTNNSGGTISSSLNGPPGGNTITITGTLTNNVGGSFVLYGAGDKATIGSVVNYSGPGLGIDLENGSSLTVNGNVANGDTQLGAIGEMGTGLNGGSGGNTLTITGTLTNSHNSFFGLLGPGDMATIGSVVTEGGIFNLENGSTLTVTGDVVTSGTQIETGGSGGNTLTINGTLTTHLDGGLILNGPKDTAMIGSIVNSPDPSDLHLGLIDVENGSTLTVKGDVNNSGSIYTSFYKGTGDNTIRIDGTLTNSPGAVFSLLNPTDRLIINGGMNLFGGAALSTPTLNNGGTINVDSLSTLLVGLGVLHGPSYNYTQLANGTLGEIINSQGSYGTITVNGSALLGGTLDILLRQGFNPHVGSIFQFLLANPGQISGTFSNIENQYFNGGTEYWLPAYDYADGIVELTAEKTPVPEPATLLVLIPGLLGVGYSLRRKLVG